MATEKTYQKSNQKNYQKNNLSTLKIDINTELSCDICGSTDIIETREGYTCRSCGIVLEVDKLEYHRPYNEEAVQYAVLGTTQIGTVSERGHYSNSAHLAKLNKYQLIKSNKKLVFDKAKIEISRIFYSLNFPDSLKKLVFTKFKKFRDALKPGTKYRSVEKLVPISIYFCFKFRNISINESELLEVSKISKKDFNAFKLQIQNFFPQYKERNRKEYILQKILEITEHFQLGMDFFYQSKKILYKLWEGIKNTKDEVIASLVCSVLALCLYRDAISINAICNRLGVKMSTIQTQVKKRIFERFKVTGFVSLVKSSNLLKKIMERLGLVGVGHETMQTEKVPEIIEIKFGSAIQVFNGFDNVDFYIYAVRDNDNLPIVVSLCLFDHFEDNKDFTETPAGKLEFFSSGLEVVRFYTGKGPPIVNFN